MRSVDAGGLSIGDDSPTRIMGVLNLSRESPYEPSVFDDPGEAARYVDEQLVGEGADVVDVGLESANKRFEVLPPEEELDRLDAAVETLESVSGDAVFSLETRYHEVAESALSRGFDAINDVCGFADPEMPRVCREHDAAVVKMASPPDLDRPGAVDDVDWTAERSAEWARTANYADKVYESLLRNGVTDKTIVDPAFGGWSEAKALADDRETFRRLREFRAIGQPVLVSINRKNFLRDVAGRSTAEALPVSLAATAMAVERGVHVVRTHDVAETRDAALVADAFAPERLRDGDVGVEELDATTVREAARHFAAVEAVTDASRTVSRLFAVEGLSADARDRLAAVASETDAVVAVAAERVLLGGSVATLCGLSERVTEPADLRQALSCIEEACP